MITLALINDPLSHLYVDIQKAIMNSHPSFNLLVIGKEIVNNDEIIEDNRKNLASGDTNITVWDNQVLIS